MSHRSLVSRITACSLFLMFSITNDTFSECKDCMEVKKGAIPLKYLEKAVKVLPSGIEIWDAPEAIAELNKMDANILWIDTRPQTFVTMGTVKGAVNLVTDKINIELPADQKIIELTSERLVMAMKEKKAGVRVVFFCQGPECHRSYNAALRSINEYGLPVAQVIWFRDGYPGLLEYINADPKLKRKIGNYLQGKVLSD